MSTDHSINKPEKLNLTAEAKGKKTSVLKNFPNSFNPINIFKLLFYIISKILPKPVLIALFFFSSFAFFIHFAKSEASDKNSHSTTHSLSSSSLPVQNNKVKIKKNRIKKNKKSKYKIVSSEQNLQTNSCLSKKYIFDIGSSTTKSKIYLIDTCAGKILKKTPYNSQHNYQYCMISSKLPKDCILSGVNALEKTLSRERVNCLEENCYGVATAWARSAENIDEWLENVRKLGIKLKVLSQQDEALLGFRSALKYVNSHKIDLKNFLYLDIGGGSFQIAALKDDLDKNLIENNQINFNKYNINDLVTSYSSYGTDNFTHFLLEKFKPEEIDHKKEEQDLLIGKNSELVKGKVKKIVIYNQKELEKVIDFTVQYLAKSISSNQTLQAKLSRNGKKGEGIVLISNGMLLRLGVKKQLGVNKNVVNKNQLKTIAFSLCNLNSATIKSKYPKLPESLYFSTQTAMIMLYAIMENLNVNELHIEDNDILDYLALSPL